MFQSNLEYSKTTPPGCAVIKIKIPAGDGAVEFQISRLGSDNVLSKNGWQPSEYWYQLSGNENVSSGEIVFVVLEKEVIQHLGNSNYTITVRRVGGKEAETGILKGGLREVAGEVEHKSANKPTGDNRAEVKIDSVFRPKFSPATIEEKIVPAEDKNKNELPIAESKNPVEINLPIDLPKLPDDFLRKSDLLPLQETPTKEEPIAVNPNLIDQKNNSPERKKSYLGLFAAGILVVVVGFYFIGMPQNKGVAAYKSIPNPTMQEANQIVNEVSDPKALYEIGDSWRKSGHPAEAYLLLQSAAEQNFGKAMLSLGEMHDPSLRVKTPATFPDENALKAANWYLKASLHNASAKDHVEELKRYTVNSDKIDDSTKSNVLQTLSQINN